MYNCNFELASLARPFLISLGGGLIVGALVYFVTRERGDWHRWKAVIIMGLAGLVIFSTAVISTLLPTLVGIPPLGGLSREEAEARLLRRSLLPSSRPQYAVGVEGGRVIDGSQSPSAGLRVRCGSTVSFAVAVAAADGASRGSDSTGASAGPQSVEVFEPKTGGTARVIRHPEGTSSMFVSGVSQRVRGGRFKLLLWIRPVTPPSDIPGWYLQRPPAGGITELARDGSWRGVAQIGNARWPAQDGHVVDVAVSVADSATAFGLIAEGGVVVRPEPVGVTSARATSVVLSFR